MKRHFGKNVKISSPQFDDHDCHVGYHQLVQFIDKAHRKYPHLLVTGCSLGGFWAHILSNQFRLPSLLMNPAMRPWETLGRYAGKNGFTQHQADQYQDFRTKNALPKTVYEPRIVLLEKGDDVLDPITTKMAFQGHADVRLLPGGSHRFDNFIEMNKAIEELGHSVTQHGA